MTIHDFLGLNGKTLLVTGASTGIGAACALEASRYGARVALLARREPALRELEATLTGDGHLVVPYDLADLDGIPDLVRTVSDRMGRLDGMVHAAGAHSTVPLRSMRHGDISSMFETNVTTAFMLAKGFRHKSVRGAKPSIVFIASAVGLVGQPGVSIYSATKGALITLTKSLALELAREGIRVNCVCPGVVMTRMTQALREQIGAENFQAVTDAHPLGLGVSMDDGELARA